MSATQPERPLFSIVTVCRNAETTIVKTIESVLMQANVPGAIEHIVVDGASTDGTRRALAAYSHLHVVSEPDSGIYDAMNKGVSMARGQYIGFLNADDWYEPDALASLAAVFHEHPATDVVYGDMRLWNRDAPLQVAKPALASGFRGMLLMPVHQPACCVRREVFDRFGRFDLAYRVFADYEWMHRVLRGGAVFRYCPRVLTNFRIGGASTIDFSIRERYRVFRNTGARVLPAWRTVAYSCAVVLRNRWRYQGEPRD